MAKTTTLNGEELTSLKKKLENQLLMRMPHLKKIKRNAYLPNYEDLKEDMQICLSADQSQSISNRRLRKLFYYTDKEICGASQLKSSNFGVDFLDACYSYILQEETTRSAYLRGKGQNLEEAEKELKDHSKAYLEILGQKKTQTIALLASGLATFISIFLLVVFRDQTGYYNIEYWDFRLLIPILFLSLFLTLSVISGLAIWGVYQLKKSPQLSLKIYTALFFTCFVLSFLIRGLKARDSYFVAFLLDKEANGLLGQPNFEVVATSLSISLSVILLSKFLLRMAVYSNFEILSFSAKNALLSTAVFALVYLVFRFLLFIGWIVERDHFISDAVFRYTFSHPQRVIGVYLLIFIGLMFILTGIKMAATSKQSESYLVNIN